MAIKVCPPAPLLGSERGPSLHQSLPATTGPVARSAIPTPNSEDEPSRGQVVQGTQVCVQDLSDPPVCGRDWIRDLCVSALECLIAGLFPFIY